MNLKLYEWKSAELNAQQFRSNRNFDQKNVNELRRPWWERWPTFPPFKWEHPGHNGPVSEKLNQGFIPTYQTYDPEVVRKIIQVNREAASENYLEKIDELDRWQQEQFDQAWINREIRNLRERLLFMYKTRMREEKTQKRLHIEGLDQEIELMLRNSNQQLLEVIASRQLYIHGKLKAREFSRFMTSDRYQPSDVPTVIAAAKNEYHSPSIKFTIPFPETADEKRMDRMDDIRDKVLAGSIFMAQAPGMAGYKEHVQHILHRSTRQYREAVEDLKMRREIRSDLKVDKLLVKATVKHLEGEREIVGALLKKMALADIGKAFEVYVHARDHSLSEIARGFDRQIDRVKKDEIRFHQLRGFTYDQSRFLTSYRFQLAGVPTTVLAAKNSIHLPAYKPQEVKPWDESKKIASMQTTNQPELILPGSANTTLLVGMQAYQTEKTAKSDLNSPNQTSNTKNRSLTPEALNELQPASLRKIKESA